MENALEAVKTMTGADDATAQFFLEKTQYDVGDAVNACERPPPSPHRTGSTCGAT